MRIVIVGAGVAGCIMARTLSRLSGAEVICLERVAQGDHAESGTGLNIGPNARMALQAHDPELTDAITAAGLPWRTWRISLTDGSVLFDLPLSQVAFNDGWRIRWSELYRVLREAAAPAVLYDCAITSIVRDGNTTSIAWRQGGIERRIEKVDFLIATDGRYSEVRRALAGEAVSRMVGVAISRVLVPNSSNSLIDDYEQWFNGPNRLLAFRVPPDHVYVATAFPIPADQPIPESLKQPEALRAAFTPRSGALSAQGGWLVDTICANVADMHWARMQEHDVLYTDPDASVLYLGDAAHGMVPTLGQGATQAIEDAAVAADLIAREWTAGRRDPRAWLEEIDALRRERMLFTVEFSREATDTMLEGADPVAGTLHKNQPDFMAKLRRLYQEVPGLPAMATKS
ncbi:FAD-dependent oxidoreductase [Rhodoplanes sp. Z2-YC6860]|uniref:FAD-dependent oxidoreductase n=1 Tax=Rhodoplanes sp. Z2-YC6860 TaxID=674703 RepID=UPI00078C7BE9|nr:NAD(P)/FAD-dependent oxidoreductase [Rhodoplanes sp. Z2-YC6860]AMN39154.1 2-polyprenyl-6-methoxyphenol hydroxylase-like oxidoreductase [Rhodoplanes sp. Z2-YC6860]